MALLTDTSSHNSTASIPLLADAPRAKSKAIGPLRDLLPFLLNYRGRMIAALVALVVTACISLILPLAVRRVVDEFNGENGALLDQYFGATIAVVGLLAVGTALRYYLVTSLGERVVTDIRKAVYDRVIGLSPSFFEHVLTGEVLSRLNSDTTLILSVISSSLSIALRNFLVLIGGMALLLFTSVKLTALVLLIVPVILVPILVLGRKMRKLSRLNQDKIAASTAEASERLLAAQTVQANTFENESRSRFASLSEAAFHAAKTRIKTRSLMTLIVIFFIFTGVACVLWIGARDVRAGTMSPGELVQFVIYSIMVAGAVGAMSDIWGELQRAAGATERLVELIYIVDDINDPIHPKPLPSPILGEITFKNVTFSYPSRPSQKIFDDFNLNIRAGETIAIVGPSGSGKSTLFQLLERFYDPTGGRILVDGIPINEVMRSDLRTQMALVPQDPAIFADTVAANIMFGQKDKTMSDVIAAAKAAAADEFIQQLPDGYDSYVGERGVMLSGGQKQRIAIARAILRDAPILLLDEATAALDAQSEHLVQAAFEEVSKDRTTLVIAHRLATVKKADRIVVVDNGIMVAQGNHDQLMRDGGLYATLAKLQFIDGMNV